MTNPAVWRATVLTLFPEMFPGPLGVSLAGKALASGVWALEARDIRASATDRHRTVDDTPAGGGPGMVMKPDALARGPGVIVVCGRFEGIDERVIAGRDLEEVSLGDYVLSGGEVAALVLLDACVRLLPGVIGAQ